MVVDKHELIVYPCHLLVLRKWKGSGIVVGVVVGNIVCIVGGVAVSITF